MLEKWRDDAWPPTAVPEYHNVTLALQDMAQWFAGLSDFDALRLDSAQAATFTCGIAPSNLSEMKHPVVAFTTTSSGKVPNVYEVKSLLMWMKTSHEQEAGRIIALNSTHKTEPTMRRICRVVRG